MALDSGQVREAGSALGGIRPMPAVGSASFCKKIDGDNKIVMKSHREAVDRISADMERFKRESGVDRVIMVNLASTERYPDLDAPALQDLESF